MGLVANMYPYTDFHEMNLDWILGEICKLHKDMDEFEVINQIKWKGTWNISKQYPIWSIVDNGNGFGYIAIKDVPAGIELTNEDYWRLTSNYSQLYADMQNRIIDLENATGNINLSYFKNKSVCIIGDSISDPSTQPPNWTVSFADMIRPVGGTVINYSNNGESFAGFANNQAKIDGIPVADIYILFMGVNDYNGQWPWTGAVTTYSIMACAEPIFNAIVRKNPNADYFYVSPLKLFGNIANKQKPLSWYRKLLETIAAKYGYGCISGYNAVGLNDITKDTYMSDGLHPTPVYAPLLAEYILKGILSKQSTVSRCYAKQLSINPVNGSGFITLVSKDNYTVNLNLVLRGVTINPGWNTVVTLPDCFMQFINDLPITVYVPNVQKHYQIQKSGTNIEFYGTSSETIDIDCNIQWSCSYDKLSNNL